MPHTPTKALYVNADHSKVVPESSPEAAYVLCGAGVSLSDDEARRYGLPLDGETPVEPEPEVAPEPEPEPEPEVAPELEPEPEPEAPVEPPVEDKEAAQGEDKNVSKPGRGKKG